MTSPLDFLLQLESVIRERQTADPTESYTASLLTGEPSRLAQKIGEEGVELALASVQGNVEAITSEAADLLYHVLVQLTASNLELRDVVAELERRHG